MASDKSVRVEVRGIRELSTAFRQVDREASAELKARFLDIARKVVNTAQGKMPHDSGKAQASVKPKGSDRGASIAFGGTAAPYMPWLDFGGSVGKGHKPGLAWSGSVKRDWRGAPSGSGRYVYPAISERRTETEQAALDAMTAAAKGAKFEVRG